MDELLEKLTHVAKVRGFVYDRETLVIELESAIEVVNDRRRFIPTETDKFPSKYKGKIIDLCISSLSKIGAEGQKGHSEGGITRSYESSSNYPESLLKDIIPLIKGY